MFCFYADISCIRVGCFRLLPSRHGVYCSAIALAQNAFEDIYLTIRDADGTDWANLLRFKMHDDDPDGALKAQFTSLSNVKDATNATLAASPALNTSATPQL